MNEQNIFKKECPLEKFEREMKEYQTTLIQGSVLLGMTILFCLIFMGFPFDATKEEISIAQFERSEYRTHKTLQINKVRQFISNNELKTCFGLMYISSPCFDIEESISKIVMPDVAVERIEILEKTVTDKDHINERIKLQISTYKENMESYKQEKQRALLAIQDELNEAKKQAWENGREERLETKVDQLLKKIEKLEKEKS